MSAFGRWVGGKQRSVATLATDLPPFTRYVEPMAGMGSLFWHLKPERALLADVNPLLVAAWRAIRDQPDQVSSTYRHYIEGEYARAVARVNAFLTGSHLPDEEADTWDVGAFLALNRRAFSGLWRVNQKGQFNVAEDKTKRGSIGKLTPEFLRACSIGLQGVDIRCASVFDVLPECGEGDLVYLDPPFFGQYGRYAASTFGPEEQTMLLAAAVDAVSRGAYVRISNADCPETRALYAGHDIADTSVHRSVSCTSNVRGSVNELLVTVRAPRAPRGVAVTPEPTRDLVDGVFAGVIPAGTLKAGATVHLTSVMRVEPGIQHVTIKQAPRSLWDAEPFCPAPPPTKRRKL